ncbi:hypothetical protein [Pseudonocardia sp. N23]|uniref:hypothetical protein n=1 Tax=Pseudonocardia sp. N23 TaxID=1987376 RepID=UPI000BFC8ACF|nr:hypothetical protein [Pseudonocardia sp. N23]GAY08024.1 hypothetical protein TOK_6217 [Pseudonocardia sp. N23]
MSGDDAGYVRFVTRALVANDDRIDSSGLAVLAGPPAMRAAPRGRRAGRVERVVVSRADEPVVAVGGERVLVVTPPPVTAPPVTAADPRR